MWLWKIAISTLIKRKKMFSLLIATVSLSIIVIISLNLTTVGINQALLENTYSKHGEHHLIIHNITSDEIQKVSSKVKISHFNEYALVGTTNIDSGNDHSPETVGWMDVSTLDLGRVNVIEGRWPTKSNEIAIESFYLSRSEKDLQIGSTVELKINNEINTFKIVGIVSDYSMNWTASPKVSKGNNDFPNIFLFQDDLNRFGDPSYHALVKLRGKSLRKVQANLGAFFNLRKGEELYESTLNEFLFTGLGKATHLKKQSTILLFFIWITSTVSMIHVFHLYYLNYLKKISIYRAFGACRDKILKIMFIQCFGIVFVSIMVAFPISFFIRKGIVYLTFQEATHFLTAFQDSMKNISIWLGLTFISVLLAVLIPLTRQLKYSIIANLRTKRKQNTMFIKKGSNRSFTLKYVLIQLSSSMKQTSLVVLSLCLGIFIMFLGQVVAKENVAGWYTNINFYLNAQTWVVSDVLHGFSIPREKGRIFDNQELAQLEQLDGVDYVDKRPFNFGVNPLLTSKQVDSSSFIKNWMNEFASRDTKELTTYSRQRLGMSNDLHVIENVEFITLGEEELERLNQQYFKGELDTSEFETTQMLVMFVPIDAEKTIDSLSGEVIKLGKIERDIDQDFVYEEWDFTVKQVINEPFSLTISDNIIKDTGRITFVLSENHNVFSGYAEAIVYLSENVTEYERMDVELKTKQLVAPFPGSLYQSIDDIKEDAASMSNFTETLSYILLVCTSCYAIVSIVSIIYGKFLTKQREWGTLRSLGMKKINITFIFVLEVLFYVISSMLLSLILVTLFFVIVPVYGDIAIYVRSFFALLGVVMIIVMVGTVFLLRLVNKVSISTLIRYTD